jgi:hypothetical protein
MEAVERWRLSSFSRQSIETRTRASTQFEISSNEESLEEKLLQSI